MGIKVVSSNQTSSISMSPEEFLSTYDPYIRQLAIRHFPRSLVPIEVVDLEVDELVQMTRLKLWKILQRQEIIHAKLYIRIVVQHLIVNMLRRPNRSIPFSFEEEEENYVQNSLFEPSWLVPDLADEYADYDLIVRILEQIVVLSIAFPPRQKQAILCLVNEQFAGEPYLAQILERQGFCPEKIFWPEDKMGKQRLKALLPSARKRLDSIHESLIS